MTRSHDELIDSVDVLRCQTGDRAAFDRLVRRYHGRLLYFVRRLAGDDRSDDLVQDVWLAVWRQLPRLREVESFRPWVYRIARNLALKRRRDEPRSAAPTPLLPEQFPDDGPEPDEASFRAEDAARVHAALARLSPGHQEVLALRFLEDMTYEQVAEVVECDLGTVKSRLHYAKRALRRELETNP